MFTVKVPKVLSKLAQGYAASEFTRYAINGVQIEPHNGRALAVATDGRKLCMGLVGDADADAHKTLLPVKEVADTVKLAKSRFTPNVRLTNGEPGRIVAQASRDSTDGQIVDGNSLAVAEIEGNFPDFRMVCESATPLFRIAVNPALLIDALKAFVEGGTDDNRAVQIHFTSSDKPMHLVGGSDDHPLYAVLMPVSVEAWRGCETSDEREARCQETAKSRADKTRKAFGLPV